MSNDLLTNDELVELTGYKYASKQCDALRRSGISFIVRKDGRPRVTWSHVNAVLNGKPAAALVDNDAGINFEGI
ncbi:DUF4224 domain-containing protein [Pectobacterium carotovorum]|uniref:DUF4224 domain-containing protein n=1 Tax=Pectobacterium carotovorum TaxID=554 RepID=UPI001E46F44F|nr:DUF4224 domain-containing protein [Pectobacterium carotovorum]UFT92864.1 DUF4224 domain-containing protein [Pectobacterium carotovorum]